MGNIMGTSSENYPDLSAHHSFMKNHVTFDVYDRYFGKKTAGGVTLDQCIQTGIDDPTLDVGIVAGDQECYETFKEVFYPVIKDYHSGYDATKQTHPNAPLDPTKIQGGVLDEKYVRSSRVRCGRSLQGFPYPTTCSRGSRRKVEQILKDVLKDMDGDLKGEYRSMAEISPEEREALVDAHLLFPKPASDFHRNAGVGRDWPDARGVFVSERRDFIVWVNEEDHIRIISMQLGGNLEEVFSRFCRAVNEIEKRMKKTGNSYQHSDNLGYLCTCPTNLGTSLRCSVHIWLPNLSKEKAFGDILKKYRLEKRGTGGEYRESIPDTWDISVLDRLGKSEVFLVQSVVDGVSKLIEIEKRLEQGKSYDDLL